MAPRWVALIGSLFLALPRTAHGIVVDPAELVHTSPLPANGVILVQPGTVGESATVVVNGPDGAVAGSVFEIEGFVGWRAHSPPDPGTYEWVLGDDNYITRSSGGLTIIDAYQPQAHELSLALGLGNAEVFGGEMLCCGPDPETRTLHSGCFHTETTQQPELNVYFASPLIPAHANQYLYRVADAPETVEGNPFDLSYRAVTPAQQRAHVVAADEYCVTIEALSLIDEQTFLTTACVPHTLSEPTFSPRLDYVGAFSVESCPEPPEGFEEKWCETLGYGCTNFPTSIAACQPVYDRCGLTPPEPVPSFGPDAGTSVAIPEPDQPSEPAAEPASPSEAAESEEEPTFACSCRTPAAPARGAVPAASLAALIVLAGITVRRARRRDRPSRAR